MVISAVLLESVAVVASVPVTGLPAVLLRRLTPAHERRSLLAGGGFSAPLAALALSAAVPLGRYAWGHLAMQRTFPAHEVHAAMQHWSGMAVYAITVVALALAVARRPVGWVAGAVVTGAFLSLLGAGSPALSPIPSSLGTEGGWAAVLGGVTFAVVARIAARSAPRSTA